MHTTLQAGPRTFSPRQSQRSCSQNHVIRSPSVSIARFMRSRDEEVGSKDGISNPSLLDMSISNRSLDEALQGTMSTMSQHVEDSLGWLRHALQDPDDFSASAIGRMVSKEYGRHERPHTERHMWASPGSSPVGSPTAQQAAAGSTGLSPSATAAAGTSTITAAAAAATMSSSHNAPSHQPGAAAAQQHGGRWGWGWGGHSVQSSSTEVWHSPPSGPGFLLQQDKRQE